MRRMSGGRSIETGEALNEEVIVLLKKGEQESVLKKGMGPGSYRNVFLVGDQ